MPRTPRQLQPKVPRDLETICLKSLEKDPHRRYASAEALAEDCAAFLRDDPITARPIRQWERALKWCRKDRALTALCREAESLILSGKSEVP